MAISVGYSFLVQKQWELCSDIINTPPTAVNQISTHSKTQNNEKATIKELELALKDKEHEQLGGGTIANFGHEVIL